MKVVSKEEKNTPAPPNPPRPTLEEDKQIVEEFKNDPDRRKIAAELAFQIQKEFPGWFTVPKLVKIFNITQAEAASKIEILIILNFCVGKVEKNIAYFKIDMSLKEQRALILEEIADYEGKIQFLKEKLSKLN